MAGLGSRFEKEGYEDPKPLIKVHGVPMIKLVIDNLRPSQDHRFIFICQKEHVLEYGLSEKLSQWAPESEIISINGLTEGAACTVLKARDYIGFDDHLMVANCDQFVDISIDTYLSVLSQNELDGLIMTMTADDPKWSFARINDENLVTEVAEKEVISNEATVGIYNFKRGGDFLYGADEMINQNFRVNNEFYVAPIYNYLIARKNKIGIYNIGSEFDGMYGLGIPSDLEKFLKIQRFSNTS